MTGILPGAFEPTAHCKRVLQEKDFIETKRNGKVTIQDTFQLFKLITTYSFSTLTIKFTGPRKIVTNSSFLIRTTLYYVQFT